MFYIKNKSDRNKTIELKQDEINLLKSKLLKLPLKENISGTIKGNCLEISDKISTKFDLLFLDPPYNLNKNFNGNKFNKLSLIEYNKYLNDIIIKFKPLLKETASIYICGDWFTSLSIYQVGSSHFNVRNRITWEREKGRGSKTNYKNNIEDIWYFTMSDNFIFNYENIKIRKKVITPYKNEIGQNKDWKSDKNNNFRDTFLSNLWTDITIPFWSMPENTDHPTQKSEKLLAKLILASTNENDFILDPFLGSGTTSVVAKKLNRNYIGIEQNLEYCLLAEKRLQLAEINKNIQGYKDTIFYDRNFNN